MAKRKIIEIDRDLCDGCGVCLTACAEGALVLDEENKAVLAKEIFCDGLGACLDVCPTDALQVIERESEEYDSKATYDHVLKTRGEDAASQGIACQSPRGSDDRQIVIDRSVAAGADEARNGTTDIGTQPIV